MSREPQSPPGPLPRRVRVYLALILALVFLIFSPGLRAGFINWDDDLSLTANPAVLEFNWDNWTDIFLPTQNPSYYQPLTFFSFAIEKQLFGLNPFIFHLNNLLLHLTCVGLVFCLTYYWGRGNWPAALLTALLFGIHPLRVESVVWITERKDVLSTLFSLAGLWTYSSALLKTNRRNYYIQLTIVWFVAACLAKPQAIIFPFLLCLIDFYFHRKFTLKTMIEKIPFLFLAAGFLAFNLRLLEPILNQKFYDSYTLVEKFCLASYGLLSMFIRTWIPTKLSLVYPFPEKTSSGDWPWMVTWAPVLVALVLYLGSRLCRHSRLYWFSLSFFILTLLLPRANMS